MSWNMTPEEYLGGVLSGLELEDDEQRRVSQKHLALRDVLAAELPVVEHFLTGSYARHTQNRPVEASHKFDVDFLLCFGPDEYSDPELDAMIADVKKVIDDYRDQDPDIVDVVVQSRSIGVVYTDNFQIDVVPAIQVEKDARYKVFDKDTQQAVITNPKQHANFVSEANRQTKLVVPLAKLAKAWRRNHFPDLKSFHCEMVAVTALAENQPDSLLNGLSIALTSLAGSLATPGFADPAAPENVIDAYLDEDGIRNAARAAAEKASQTVAEAVAAAESGDDDEAIDKLDSLFTKEPEKHHGPIRVQTAAKPWAEDPGH